MKKLLLPLLGVFLFLGTSVSLKAQNSSILFCENFDVIPWQMTTSGSPAADAPLFTPDSNVYRTATGYSATDTVGYHYDGIPIQSYLTSPVVYGIDTPSFVSVKFFHIAYIETADRVYVEVSFDGGVNWIRVGKNYYEGSSNLMSGGGFSKLSRPFLWKFIPNNDTTFIWNNSNAAWIEEEFNLQPLIDANTADSMQVRIVLEDSPSSFPGRVGTHRYYIDEFCIFGSDCPPGDPEIDLEEPINYPNQYIGNVYLEGPYLFNASATSPSTIDSVYVEYIVKRDVNDNGNYVVVEDSVALMAYAGGTSYNGQIPETSTEIGDSVYWRVRAIDASPCAYDAYEPNQGYNEFEVRGNLPISCTTTPIANFPYVETFDNWIMTSSLDNMQNDWENVRGDFHNWWLWAGPTPTANTGPQDDYPGGGQYLYVETTGYYDSTAFLLTPCIDLSELENAKVRFYLHQLTDGTDTVWVDIFNTTPLPGRPYGKFDENIVPPIPGNKGDRWLPVEFTTYPYRNKVTQIRIRARPSKTSEQSDIALDSFRIGYSPLVDLRAERVVIGPYLPENEVTDVVINVQNQGVFPTDSILLNYDIILESTGQVFKGPRDYLWEGVIPPGEDSAIALDQAPFNAPLGEYTIKAWLEYSGDEVVGNDTTQQRTYGLAYKNGTFYFETFDKPNRDTIFTARSDADTIANVWEFGTPSYDKTNSAFSTQSYNTPFADFNCWDILLDRPYVGDGNTVQLVTPFIDFTNAQNPYISFFNNRDIDTTKAGVYLEYSLDRGFTWDSVPAVFDTQRKRWYNSYLAAGGFGGQPVFAGITSYMQGSWNGWVESELKLPPNIFAGEDYVLFRFMFFAEDFQDVTSGFNSNDGMSIDNFHVYDEVPTDLEVQHIIRPENECDKDSIERFRTVFKNRGQNVISSFDVEYVVRHIPTGATVSKSETVTRTIQPRDTAIINSVSDFDMRPLGDYEVKVIISVSNDGYPQNDTAIKYVENIDGCWMVFQAVTSFFERPFIQDSSYWKFEYTSGGREYYITDHYEPFEEFDTNRLDICIRKNADVVFDLGDVDTAIVDYSLYAYNGEVDTMIVQQENGGPESPIKEFHWVCPPERSAKTIDIIIDKETVQPPIAKDYLFEMEFLNNGLDSIREIQVGMSVDGERIRPDTVIIYDPAIEYNRKSGPIVFGTYYLSPGTHTIKAWTHNPNYLPDELPEDDTLSRRFTILDTARLGGGTGDGTYLDPDGNRQPIGDSAFCTDFEFENPDSTGWLIAEFPNWRQKGTTFEVGTPSTPNINGARSGNYAMVTNADSSYINFDSSAVYSPFFELRKDSCYLLNFHHNYHFEGEYNDGAQVLMSLDTGYTWELQNRRVADVGDTLLQQGWYNTRHVIAIEDNNANAGWSGQSNGWVYSQTYIPSYRDAYAKFAFRFASDGNFVSDGWAFDDFCIMKIAPTNCFAVGLGEKELDVDKLYLGQSVPNPAVNRVEIPYYLPTSGQVYFEVTNMMGQKVRAFNMSKAHGNHLMEIDISELGSGVYYYWIVFEGRRLSKKMIITK